MREKLEGEIRSIRIFIYAILLRLAVYILSGCIMAMFGDYENIQLQDFLDTWTRWDSTHYLNIAQNGYMGAIENGEHLFLVFYPLYPWIIRITTLITQNYQISGLLISVICFGIGCVYLDKIMCMEFGEDEATASCALLAVYPFSFFFGAILTESLFLAVLTAFFYYLRTHQWWKAALAGFLACLTKVQGMLLAFCVIAELMVSFHGLTLLKNRKWKLFFKDIILNGMKCLPMIGGVLIYLAVNYFVEGDPFRFMYYQKNHWNNSLCPIWHTYSNIQYYAFKERNSQTGMALWIPEYLLFFVYLIAIIYGFIKKYRLTYLIYLVLYFLLTYSSTWLISGSRYSINAVPVFMMGGCFLTKHQKIKPVVYMCSLAFMVVYLVGYYQWKPIM